MTHKRQMCIDCKRKVVHHDRVFPICLDCLIARLMMAMTEKKRLVFQVGLLNEVNIRCYFMNKKKGLVLGEGKTNGKK